MIQNLYNKYIRPHAPNSSKICVRNGVAVRGTTKVTDLRDHLPDHEEFVGEVLRSRVRSDDKVIIIGGGYGVTTVIAARQADFVITYEASDSQYERLKDTISLNRVENVVEPKHRIVSKVTSHNAKKYGDSSAEVISPTDLPSCDVLQMDCEGAELEILDSISINPRLIIVETHGFLGSTEKKVTQKLSQIGYKVIESEIEIQESGVIQLVASRK